MIYLDNAATSRFKPQKTIRALTLATKRQANPGRSSHKDAVDAGVKCYKTREKLKSFFHSDGHAIFTKNCTEALNLALTAIPNSSHVITTVAEHNSVLRPLYNMARQKKISLTVLPLKKEGHVDTNMLLSSIRHDTKCVVINHVSNVNGVKSDIFKIGKIAKEKNLLFIVDGAQSAGHVDINVNECNIDALALPCHKGLLAPQGLGALILNEKVNVKPLLLGGTGVDSQKLLPSPTLPDSYEAGTVNYPAISALYESLIYLEKHGKTIQEKTEKLSQEFLYGLKNIKKVRLYTPINITSGVIAFNIDDTPSTKIGDILSDEYDIAVRAGLHCAPLMHKFLSTLTQGAVRVSIGANNTEKDIKITLCAIEDIVRRKSNTEL
ncbi:MAG: aminotransferase class V-fold PLP-dependent enzyme [Clostridia bacterium]|nr:aminotransferase class V-fold PLP-dependent enzyme [Clostridia bacterium]